MLSQIASKKRMKWDDIQRTYPSQWVGLTDVKWNGSTSRDIDSAVVSCVGEGNEIYLLYSQHKLDAALFTTPDNDILTSGVNYG